MLGGRDGWLCNGIPLRIPGGILSYKLFDICTQHVKHVHNMSSLAGQANKLPSVCTHILGYTLELDLRLSYIEYNLHLKAQIFSFHLYGAVFFCIRSSIQNEECWCLKYAINLQICHKNVLCAHIKRKTCDGSYLCRSYII